MFAAASSVLTLWIPDYSKRPTDSGTAHPETAAHTEEIIQ